MDLTFIHPRSKKTCTVIHTQVPIVPAFAMTAHRAQGQTIEKVIINLESCRGTEAPYVMLSRATSLDSILILRPFQQKCITCALSQDARIEKHRLHELSLHTLIKFGNRSQAEQASQCLTSLHHHLPITEPNLDCKLNEEEPDGQKCLLPRLQDENWQRYTSTNYSTSDDIPHLMKTPLSNTPSSSQTSESMHIMITCLFAI
ncbi:hypothetical protein L208DRAFT_1329163 [Tricholoma matsutake]|nr:hypothetical protein L208DRAFT_1329163 [Tricholoma matsutake 945]